MDKLKEKLAEYKKKMSDLSDYEKSEIRRMREEALKIENPYLRDHELEHADSFSAEDFYQEELDEEWYGFYSWIEHSEPNLFLIIKYVSGSEGIQGYRNVKKILCRAIEYLETENELPPVEGEVTIFNSRTFQVTFKDLRLFILKYDGKEVEIQHLNEGAFKSLWQNRCKKRTWSISEEELGEFVKNEIGNSRSAIKNVKDFWREMKKSWGYNFLKKLEKLLGVNQKADLEMFKNAFLWKDKKTNIYWLVKP